MSPHLTFSAYGTHRSCFNREIIQSSQHIIHIDLVLAKTKRNDQLFNKIEIMLPNVKLYGYMVLCESYILECSRDGPCVLLLYSHENVKIEASLLTYVRGNLTYQPNIP